MLDLQRNLLTTLLAIGTGVLVLAGGALAFLMGRPDVASIPPRGQTEAAEVQVDVPQTGLEDFSSYSAIVERPVFFSDRQLPVVETPGDEEQMALEEEQEVEEVKDLEAAVAGIVITPELKLAMVSDEQAGKTFVLREGMSLEGEQAAWKLETIEPRMVSFVSVDGRKTDLELQVNTSGLTVPPSASRANEGQQEAQQQEAGQPAQPADERQASDEARARAEEIRRRVAERRAELRAEAERRARQRQQEQDNNG
ncbi:MAG: hypothetical protein U5L08_12525 [Xanthomonadales bacterium]|nr:hypothetical protein [Xanthomonadales bacterium]